MIKRLLSAFVLIALTVYLVFNENTYPFAAVIATISVWSVHEFYQGIKKLGYKPIEWAGILGTVLLVFSVQTYHIKNISSIFPAILTSLLFVCYLTEFFRQDKAPVKNISTTVFGVIYVGWLISHMVALRVSDNTIINVYGYYVSSKACLVMFAFLCTWACDTGAFFAGKSFGKHKIASVLSPNKTYEGSIGGLIFTMLIALGIGYIIKLPWVHSIIMGAVFGILSQVGDLSESAIKREIGIKDFGNIVPGHGGFLDRIDSMLFTAPAAYYYCVLFLQHWPK